MVLSTSGDTDSSEDSENNGNGGENNSGTRDADRPSNAANPAGALDSIESEKKGKDRGRPSIDDPESEWDGAKSRPSGSPIDSTTKAKDRARDADYVDDWESDDLEERENN